MIENNINAMTKVGCIHQKMYFIIFGCVFLLDFNIGNFDKTLNHVNQLVNFMEPI